MPSITSAPSFFKAISLMGEIVRKNEEYIKKLEEERSKIEAFKRELPFCMQLLNDAIEASKKQLADCQQSFHYESEQNVPNTNGRPLHEEFIPIKKTSEQTCEKSEENHANKPRFMIANGDKPNWMISAQLWNPDPETVDGRKGRPICVEDSRQQQSVTSNSKLFSDSKQRVGLRGAFHPFSRERQVISPMPVRSNLERTLPDIALSSTECKHDVAASANTTSRSRETTEVPLPTQAQEKESDAVCNAGSTSQSQSQRKSRRCWSPELHRRFVNALQHLGGPQVATPKQIRELMKVDGLTNDEVKSHLQKYRLHTRRPSAAQNANPQPPQLVVLGGIWMPPEYAATQQGQSLYSPVPPSSQSHYYSQINSPAAASHLQLHHSMYSYCDLQHQHQHQQTPPHSHTSFPCICNGQSSGARSVGEDEQSDTSSWRAEEYGDHESIGRSSSLRKQFLDENDEDADADAEDGRVQVEKQKNTEFVGR